MLHYDKICVSEGIGVNKTSGLKEWDVYHYWYFLKYSSQFQPNVCSRCHSLFPLLMMLINLSYIAISSINRSYYLCIISLISKNEAIKLMQNANLTEKSGTI